MASACETDEETFSGYESETSEESDSEQQSDPEDVCQVSETPPCKYYNKGGCKNGGRCAYLHVCKFFQAGNCKYGRNCKLNHSADRGASSGRSRTQDGTSNPKLTNGRFYQWQINDRSGWKDICNDQVLEAQYSLPHNKSIKIYNTPYGAVSIDFNKMRVYGKNLKVRRLDDGNTVWCWYCTLRRKWIKYGEKDSKGNSSPVQSSDIERKFQSNPTSSYTFNVGAETFEIRFPEMRQVGQKKKRRVTRRPQFRQQQTNIGQVTVPMQNLSLGKPQWQFEGDSGTWHEFKRRSGTSTECSVTSEKIERKYQQNPGGGLSFKMNGHSYQLDFNAMIQTNLKTNRTRRIRLALLQAVGYEEETDIYQDTAVSGKSYEWQLYSGNQWLRIDNDHVIECHYCQPGAKGITINTNQGQVFIDFDTLQINNPALAVQRRSLLPQGLTEDVGWYYRDDYLWCEYGAQNSSMLRSSISSTDIERHFALNPQGSLRFSVGTVGYSVDFPSMTQSNLVTGLSRNVRRRPKFPSNPVRLILTPIPSLSSPPQLPQGIKWEFMAEEGLWTEYQAHICSFDSGAIESQYQLNQQGQLHFRINRYTYTYTLDFSSMCQINNEIGTRRSVRRTTDVGIQNSSSSSPSWQFLDIDGMWKEYTKGHGQCSVSSSDIELQYQQNPSGSLTFTTKWFSYELNFSSWTQTNLSTNTVRSVRRFVQ